VITQLEIEKTELLDGFKPEEILGQIEALDITNQPKLLLQAYKTVIEGYKDLSSNLENDEVRKLLYPKDTDPFVACHRARIIATVFRNPNTSQEIVSGTVRLITGTNRQTDGVPSIEATSLISVPIWPHQQLGIPEERIGEFGRFAIDKKFRDLGASTMISTLLFQEIQKIIKSQDLKIIYAIMPSYVYKLTQKIGMKTLQIKESSLIMTPENKNLFDAFYKYWGSNPQLYIFESF